ncbi:alpha-glucosidase [Alkalibacillus filiformis]|uniref:Alpha-glucosidase n=1 Tax=Alkalibacillus filiformis TaxID=200990 RepID=A0ABU0DUN8_9BACI|nr:glycoside hydrolase family 31 protein [Alkalibacillus filiformis]MDQ0352176.1 alpha-glucosidase [Alkalibacillus filiformis]
MEDTSFAIHPGKQKDVDVGSEILIGDLNSFKVSKQGYEFHCDNGYVVISFVDQEVVRIVMNLEQPLNDESSVAVIQEPQSIQAEVYEEKKVINLVTSYMEVTVQKSPFRVFIKDYKGELIVADHEKGMGYEVGGKVFCSKEADDDDQYYGFGEKSGFINKKGEVYTMWNSDVYAPHNPETDPLYQSIPFFMTLRNGQAHGIYFDNTFKTTFDMRTEESNEYCFSAEGGRLDYYVFIGPTPKEVLNQYTYLTGRMPLPPKWALGYHQSRYSYESEEEVRTLVSLFREKEIPLDAVHFDIHYMDEYRVFTFDYKRFPNPKRLVSDLKEQGVRSVPIVDPGVKVDSEYETYVEGITDDLFCKYIEGNLFFGDVWPGKSAFPDFAKTKTRSWWGRKHQFYTDLGIEGIWNDMNEPAVFNETKTMDVQVVHDQDGEKKTHRELHNVYGMLMGKATYEGLELLLDGKRPFLLTRAGFSGIQRYAAVWTGDNRSFWEHLEMAIPMCMNLGVSGVPFSGADVGGFAHDASGELLVRWTQLGVFTPYFRNHSAIHTARQEPWMFGKKYEESIKSFIQLRYKWLPYLYQQFKQASETGVPVMRPLFMEYPNDQKTYNLSDQFLVGDRVLVAPVLRPGATSRMVYLPKGDWFNYWNGDLYKGGKCIIVDAPLQVLPIFVKKGSIIPEANELQSTNDPVEHLTLHVYPSESKTTYSLYDDDGETFNYRGGEYFELELQTWYDRNQLHLVSNVINSCYKPNWSKIDIVVHGLSENTEVIYNKKKVAEINAKSNRFSVTGLV